MLNYFLIKNNRVISYIDIAKLPAKDFIYLLDLDYVSKHDSIELVD